MRAFVAWTVRWGVWLWVVALALAVPATMRTVSLYAHLRSELEELLPRNAPSVRALDELRSRVAGAQYLGVVVEAKDAKDLAGAERLLDDLAARVRAYGPTMVREVRTGGQAERAFLERHAALYVGLDDLTEVRKRITARREWENARAFGALMDDDEKPPSTDVADIEKKYQRDAKEGGRLTSVEIRTTVLSIEAADFSTGDVAPRKLLERVQADVAALDPAKYAPGLSVGYASDIAVNVEELDALKEDLSISTVLVFAAVIAVIVLYYSWWRSILALMPPLLVATVYAFGLASLPPARVTELNSNTAFLGSIIVGNGINVGLILLARYREERLRGTSVNESLVRGVWGAAPGTLAAAAAASVAYASLVVTEFRGFRQFGVIGGLGMLAAWATAFVLMPPLLSWLDSDEMVHTRAARAHGTIMSPLLRFIERTAPIIVVLAVGLGIAAAVKVARFQRSMLESDFNQMRRRDTFVHGEGYWGRKMDAVLGRYLTPTVVLCDDEAQARALAPKLRASVEKGPLAPFVAAVVTVDDVLPREQPEKLAELTKIRAQLTDNIRKGLPEQQQKQLDTLLGDPEQKPLALADLPTVFTAGLREKNGSFGRTILLYPRPTEALRRTDGIRTFVSEIRSIAATELGPLQRPARIAGGIPLTHDIIDSMLHDGPIASGVSFVGVVLVVIFVVRQRRASSWVIGSLLLGVLWLAGMTFALGIKINFTNFIAFPITFGIGVDYAVNVATRYVQDGESDITGAVRSTGGAVALCSATTIIGYSSLLLAKNRGLFLFGALAVMGEIACLTAAIVVLPAALSWWRRRGGARS